ELPAGFADQYTKETAGKESTAGLLKKSDYLALFNKVREATLAALDKIPEAELDKAITGNIARIAPTVGALFYLTANHEMMHAGQFAVLRRKLGKPIVI